MYVAGVTREMQKASSRPWLGTCMAGPQSFRLYHLPDEFAILAKFSFAQGIADGRWILLSQRCSCMDLEL